MSRPELPIVPDDVLARVAHIIGPHSAAAGALRSLAEHRAKGGNPVCVQDGERLVVIHDVPKDAP